MKNIEMGTGKNPGAGSDTGSGISAASEASLKAGAGPGSSSAESVQYRINITREANLALEKCIEKVSDGFDASSVKKSDVADYLILKSVKDFSESDVRAIRSLHFDERKVLNSFVRGPNENLELPEELKRVLREHYGLTDKERKRPSKGTSEAA